MERLTVPDELIEGGKRRAIIDARAVKAEAMTFYWALKKYEDTGLTPGEIKNLLKTGKYKIMDCTGCIHKGNKQFCLNCSRGGSRDYYLAEEERDDKE